MLAGLMNEIVAEHHTEDWLMFCLLGGYCYFDASYRVIQINALVLINDPPIMLHMIGPYPADSVAVEWMHSTERVWEVTLAPLREVGFEQFGWCTAGETPGGNKIHPDVTPQSGAFVYRTKDGVDLFYELVGRANLKERRAYFEKMKASEAKEEGADRGLLGADAGLR